MAYIMMCCELKQTLVLILVLSSVLCAMCNVWPSGPSPPSARGQMCIDDLANGGRHHYQSTKASTGLLIIIHTSSPQLSLSPSPIWSACPITNHSDFHQNFPQFSNRFRCVSHFENVLWSWFLLRWLSLVGPKLFRSLPTNVPQIGCEQILVKSTLQI